MFQCELTGKSNLTYFEACQSEALQTAAIQKRFPEPLKEPVLRAAQFQITGRLDNLVDQVAERFKDRFFPDEPVFVEVQGDRFYAVVKKVHPPRAKPSDAPKEEGEEEQPEERPIHRIGTNLALDDAESARLDNPDDYLYSVQLVDEEGKFTGSITETRAKMLSRDRLVFSKSILRKFLRDSVVRDASIGSPWFVRESLAKWFNIPTRPPDEIALKNEGIKDAKLSKRRKVRTAARDVADRQLFETEGSIAKREAREARKSMYRAAGATLTAERAREAAEAGEDEKRRAEAKRAMKYPAEDTLLEPIDEQELATETPGELPKQAQRPALARAESIGVPAEAFEPFMTVYYFLLTLGKPLGISTMALDDFEAALRHHTHDPPCPLLCEVHGVLLNAIIRDGAHCRDFSPAAMAAKQKRAQAADAAPGAANGEAKAEDAQPEEAPEREGNESAVSSDLDDDLDESPERVVLDAAQDIGGSWERRQLRPDDHRRGWESAVVGCLASRATEAAFPRLIGILSHLTGIEHEAGMIDGEFKGDKFRSAAERYAHLPISDRLQILMFLCEQAVMTRVVKAYYEECENHLTELRKERIELSRARKRLVEQRQELDGVNKPEVAQAAQESQASGAEGTPDASASVEQTPEADSEEPAADEGSEEESEGEEDSDSERDELEESGSEASAPVSDEDLDSSSDAGSERYRRTFGSRQESLREKALQREAEQAKHAADLARAREQQREKKEHNAERRRLDEEEQRVLRREDTIEREFRRYALIPRMRPLGKDRFLSRYYWFDGIGNASITGHGGTVLYQTGRIFVQAPSAREWELLCAQYAPGGEALERRREHEYQPEYVLGAGEWGVFSEPDQVRGCAARPY